MNSWYTVRVKYTKEQKDGTLQRVNEPYLLNALSFTEAEARIYEEVGEFVRGEFMVTGMAMSNFADIFFYGDSEKWWKVKVSYVSNDADSGKEKIVANNFLVTANSSKEAIARIEESLKGLMANYDIPDIKLTGLIDVFPYEGEDGKKKTKKKAATKTGAKKS